MSVPSAVLDWVERLHGVVDELVGPLATIHADRLQCREGCAGCCVDELTVFAIEAAVIERHHGPLLAGGEAHPEGGCAFLDAKGACRIYAHRPYVCRTQGLPLRWLEEEEGEPVEVRDVCPLNASGPALEELPADACWTLGPIEERLRARQEALGDVTRRSLRSLFHTASDEAPRGRIRLPVTK